MIRILLLEIRVVCTIIYESFRHPLKSSVIELD